MAECDVVHKVDTEIISKGRIVEELVASFWIFHYIYSVYSILSTYICIPNEKSIWFFFQLSHDD